MRVPAERYIEEELWMAKYKARWEDVVQMRVDASEGVESILIDAETQGVKCHDAEM